MNFIDAKSMITPGIAGGIVMFVTNALAVSFHMSVNGPVWVALGLSFVCGLLVFADKKLGLGPRIAFYLLNSLIIFATATGTNGIGREVAASGEKGHEAAVSATPIVIPAPTLPPGVVPTPGPAPTAIVVRPPVNPMKAQRTFFKPWLQTAAQVQRPN